MSAGIRDFVNERAKLIRALTFEIDFATRGLDPEVQEDVRRAVARVVTDPADVQTVKRTLARLLP